MRNPRCRWIRAMGVAAAVLLAAPPGSMAVDSDQVAGMELRSIGPAGMSGRVAALDAVASNPDIMFVGAATGGVWKSENGGLTWESVFDDQDVASIGAVAVFQPNPDIVWVGTGEGNPRNSISVGGGVYRSLDGGETWRHLGLAGTRHIHRIVLHPTDPDTAYVAALGHVWEPNEDRGVYKTTDGGRTWEKILYVDPRTGAGDLAMDPAHPNRLLAAMWEYQREPWFFRSGGPGSGLYLSVDGGETWTRLGPEDGLPAGELGRIGIAFSRSQPEIVYAVVEAEVSALLRSDDGGRTWIRVNEDPAVARRPFYFADLRVDPQWPDRVYNLWSLVSVSDDGGKTFRILVPFRAVHPDHHAMWINPNDPEHIVLGNDGGVAVSRDRGETWDFVANLPLAQYYHIAVDRETPYHVYGGMQDNGSWRGPAEVWENGGIRNHHWREVGFGDGFDTRPDPEDALRGYSMSQEGYLRRYDLRTGERKDIRPPAPEGTELRFNWNAAFAQDPFDPATIYYGSQFVHRSTDRGETWTIISPDLTTNNPAWQRQAESGGLTPDVTGAENFTTLVAIAPSPIQRGLVWVGSDDGRIHVTRDGGRHWESVEKNLRGVPPNTWVPHIEPSRHDPAEAFVVLDNHRRGDLTPYVFKTGDYGRHWTRLARPNLRGYALCIVQDFENPDLLFLGTEFGLWVSLDGGGSWIAWNHGLPTVSVMDLALQPDEHDLVVGTHGRGAWILDDIRPLRELSDAVLREALHVFPPGPAQQYRVAQTGESRFPGSGEFRGENEPYGALITFSVHDPSLPDRETLRRLEELRRKQPRDTGRPPGLGRPEKAKATQSEAGEAAGAPRGPQHEAGGGDEEDAGPEIPEVTVHVYDRGGTRVRTFQAPVHRGVNRLVWNLRRDPFREPPRERPWWQDEPAGPEMPPGRYEVEIVHGEHRARVDVEVLPDPRRPYDAEARDAHWRALTAAGTLQETVAEAVARIADLRGDLQRVREKLRLEDEREGRREHDGPSPRWDAFRKAAAEFEKGLARIERELWVPPKTKGIVAEHDALSKIRYVLGSLQSSWDAPTPAQRAYLDEARRKTREAVAALNVLLNGSLTRVREAVPAELRELLRTPEPMPAD